MSRYSIKKDQAGDCLRVWRVNENDSTSTDGTLLFNRSETNSYLRHLQFLELALPDEPRMLDGKAWPGSDLDLKMIEKLRNTAQ